MKRKKTQALCFLYELLLVLKVVYMIILGYNPNQIATWFTNSELCVNHVTWCQKYPRITCKEESHALEKVNNLELHEEIV